MNKASAVTDVRKSRVQVKNKVINLCILAPPENLSIFGTQGVQTEIGSLDHEMCTSGMCVAYA